ncbi:MAG: ergothioneine biosynthesis protein EgtB [Candidatus Dormibacteria bacterium]
MDLKARIADALDSAARDTVELIASLDDDAITRQQDPLMSPLVWDYAHVGVYEELWLVHAVRGSSSPDGERFHVYDAFENPRSVRAGLPLMSRGEVDAYRSNVRGQALDLLEEIELADGQDLTRGGFVYDMVSQHERQHQETMLQTLQLSRGRWRPVLPDAPQASTVDDCEAVSIPAGTYPVGSDEHSPYDNEHGLHHVTLPDIRIDRYPVSCRRYIAFIDDGGYSRSELWTHAGWAWRQRDSATAPGFWRRDGESWIRDRFGHAVAVRPDDPVMHVCAHEADAFARWAGGRLPTEQEWEVAASWDPSTRRARRFPWGDEEPAAANANLSRSLLGPAPLGAYPGGESALGCAQMIGDVWEWTSSDFLPYPGFRPFPYREYSEVFFGPEYRVLRGASWAADRSVGRVTFRNWDYPIRRQIFAGFRCADRALDR